MRFGIRPMMFAAMSMVAATGLTTTTLPTTATVSGTVEERARPTKRKAALATVPRKYRSRAAQAKPRKRPNMRHVSRRVRRKHRRAA